MPCPMDSYPATGTWRFYFHDHLGSTRRMRNAAGASIAQYEFEPYGGTYAATGTPSATTHQWAGLEKDSGPYHYAPYRTYNNVMKRWVTRDPLGMINGPNVYAYVTANLVQLVDPIGLYVGFPWSDWPGWDYLPSLPTSIFPQPAPYSPGINIANRSWVKKCRKLLQECQGDRKVKDGLDEVGDRIYWDDDLGGPGLA